MKLKSFIEKNKLPNKYDSWKEYNRNKLIIIEEITEHFEKIHKKQRVNNGF